MTDIEAQIDRLTLELCGLTDRYRSDTTYTVPDTPRRIRELQELLNGKDGRGGLWAKRRAEIALSRAGGRERCLGPTDAGKKRGQRGIV